MSGETDRRIEQLLAALRDDNEALRDHAVASLGQLGAAAIERLINLFADEDRVIREAARQAVVQVGADAVPALLEALRDDDWAVREQAAEALGSLKDERASEPRISSHCSRMRMTWFGKRRRGRCRVWAGPRRTRKAKESSNG